MSRSPKSPSLFGLAEGYKRFFIRSEFLYCLSAFLPLIVYQHFFFPKQKKKRWQRKSAFFTYGDRPAASGRWKSSAQEAVAQELAGSSGSFYFFGWFEVLACFFTFEGYRAQTPCDLYSLLLVISYHPPASHGRRSVFY